MQSAAWFVLFPRERLPSADASADVTAVLRDTPIDVVLNTEPYVAVETREALARHGQSLLVRAVVERFDARIELRYDAAAIGELFEPLLVASERLALLTGGVVYESDSGAFHDALDVNLRDPRGFTALHHAAADDEVDLVRALLAAGATVDPQLEEGLTPLHLAAAWESVEVARLLLAAGADPRRRTDRGETPLDLAEHKDPILIIPLLEAAMNVGGSED